MKKTIIITFAVIAVLFVALLTAPFLFKGKILELAKTEFNKMFNAKVDFADLDLSFIRHFPDASVKLKDFYIAGIGDFEGDTLVSAGDLHLVANLKSFFGDSGYEIKTLELNKLNLTAHILKDGRANWNIMKDTAETESDTSAMAFNFQLRNFAINHANIFYIDDESNMCIDIQEFNHHTSGNFTADSSLLVTRTTIAALSFLMDGEAYVSKAKIALDADIDANLNKMIFRIAKNATSINEIKFAIDGWVQSLDEGLDMDLMLNAESLDFKSILSMIPVIYTKDFSGLKADGEVSLSGFAKGRMVDNNYPAFDVALTVKNAWFSYPDLPKRLENINIDAKVNNAGGNLDNTVVKLSNLSFSLGGNQFSLQAVVTHPISDMDIMASAAGKLNLGMISEVYPLDKQTSLNGTFDLNLALNGKMSYYEKDEYEKFNFKGQAGITDLLLKISVLPQEVKIPSASLVFNNNLLDLQNLTVNIGKNDISANGKVENYLAYALHDKTLKGNLKINSKYLNINDFMNSGSSETSTSEIENSESEGAIIIPKNLDFDLVANFGELVYDKMDFKNAEGNLKIAGGELIIKNLQMNAFEGTMGLTGKYSTADTLLPKADFDLNIKEVSFGSILSQMAWLQSFAPILEQATGKFSTKISLATLLKTDMMPDLATLVGNGNLQTSSVGLSNVPALEMLAAAVKKSDIMPMSIKDLSLLFDIKDGKLNTKPFSFKVGDVGLTLGGTTGLDQSIAYSGKIALPDKLTAGKLQNLNFTIGGNFTKPQVKVDVASMINDVAGEKVQELKDAAAQKIDETKTKAIAEARIKADQLLAAAQKQGENLVTEAQKQGDALVSKAANPIAKKAAEIAAQKLVDEAKKQADTLNAKAKNEADNLIKKTEEL